MFGNGPGIGATGGMANMPTIPPVVGQVAPPATAMGGNVAGGGSNPFAMLMKALFNPKEAAGEMAQMGVTPEELQAQIDASSKTKLADTMKAASSSTAEPPQPFSFSQVGKDLMQPIGQRPSDLASEKPLFLGQDLMNPQLNAMQPQQTVPQVAQTGQVQPQPFSFGQVLKDLMQPVGKPPIATADATGMMGIPPPPLSANLPIVPPVTGQGQASPGANLPQLPVVPPVVPPANATTPVPPTTIGKGWTPEANTPVKLQDRPTNVGAREKIQKGLSPEINAYIDEVATKYGLDPNYLKTQAMIESGGNPKAHNKSGADGLFQFIPSTAKQYGVDSGDWKSSTDGAARLALDNKQYLQKSLGREPTYGELYLAHQQGAGGAVKLLSNPDAKAADLVGKAAVIQNGGSADMTAQEFANLWTSRYENFGGVGSDTGTGSGTSGSAAADASGGTTATPEMSLMQRLAAMGTGLTGDSQTDQSLNLPDAPAPVAPRPGAYSPDANVMKMMLMLLSPGAGGAAIPTLMQLMSGKGVAA